MEYETLVSVATVVHATIEESWEAVFLGPRQ
jgi:hypothetical protein